MFVAGVGIEEEWEVGGWCHGRSQGSLRRVIVSLFIGGKSHILRCDSGDRNRQERHGAERRAESTLFPPNAVLREKKKINQLS